MTSWQIAPVSPGCIFWCQSFTLCKDVQSSFALECFQLWTHRFNYEVLYLILYLDRVSDENSHVFMVWRRPINTIICGFYRGWYWYDVFYVKRTHKWVVHRCTMIHLKHAALPSIKPRKLRVGCELLLTPKYIKTFRCFILVFWLKHPSLSSKQS